ncbi:MAG TPA: type II toxin-antitoxin system RelE/ParE family toxin [Acidobacteriaceae bacterium]|nr:type II toxin-antitoxin system RelE/ParE family toxin [Acidobacteriaceae bacterium]
MRRYAVHFRKKIRSFRHAGLERFFFTGSKAGIQPTHARRLEEQLSVLNVAKRPEQMKVPGWKLHALKGDLRGQWAVAVSGNWRMTFCFEGEDAILVDYRDYH